MNPNQKNIGRGLTLAALSLALAGTGHAQERESLEVLKQTTLNLINALVDKGVLTREAADALIKNAQTQAAAQAAATLAPASAMAPGEAAGAAQPATTASGKPVIRVPYIPESVKNQIREEIRGEIVSQARAERWGVPGTLPTWMNRIKIDGDFRFRLQSDDQNKNNTPATDYLDSEIANNPPIIRAPDFAAYTGNTGQQSAANTQDSRFRERIRLRLGVSAKVSDEVGVGVRLATGSQTDRVSTNQTLGQNANKYQLLVDRAFVRYDPLEWLTVQGGRIPNPWFNTNMVWDDDLNFEGLAVTSRVPKPIGTESDVRPWEPFMTLGAFPLREPTPAGGSRWLYGAQVGTSWAPSTRATYKLGLAYYDYKNLEGRAMQSGVDYIPSSPPGSTPDPTATYQRYEYPASLRQKGNTLFETNPSAPQNIAPVWGLAYKFRPITLTGSAQFDYFSPYSLMLEAEYVRNTAFSAADFQRRFAQPGLNPGGRNSGYQFKFGFGHPKVSEFGQWQASLTYRHLGSDAVLDAFTDSDLGLGGTNVQGYILDFAYGLDHDTSIGAKYYVSRTLDTPINALAYPDASYKVNTLMVDLNVRF